MEKEGERRRRRKEGGREQSAGIGRRNT